MATLQQIQTKGETLARALAEVQKEIAVTRANLEAAAVQSCFRTMPIHRMARGGTS